MKTSLQQVTQTEKSALEMSMLAWGDIKHLQKQEYWAKNTILYLENMLQQTHLKFCKNPEGEKGSVELSVFIPMWLALLMNLEEGVAP